MSKVNDLIFLNTYRWVVTPVGLSLALLGSLFNDKLRRGIKMRMPTIGSNPYLDFPTKTRPIWIHTSSGEFEYAKPLITQIKTKHPDVKILVTYFSPSYKANIERYPGVDMSCPLPLDLPGPIHGFLSHHQPRALLIARTDLWPELLNQSRRLNIPIMLFSASRPTLRWTHKAFKAYHRWLFSQLNSVFCVTEADRENLLKLGAPKTTKAIGDTRYDQVLERLEHPQALRQELFTDTCRPPCLVAGSTWQEDEAVLIPAVARMVKSGHLRLIIAPHEPSDSHIKHLMSRLADNNNLEACLYSKASTWDPRQVLIIDQIGILAELYQMGDLAFVGGSFKARVHSVMEPLAAGCITFVGPHHKNNREALDFQRIPLSLSTMVTAVDSDLSLHDQVQALLQEKDSFALWKSSIKDEVLRRTGATEKLMAHLQGSIL